MEMDGEQRPLLALDPRRNLAEGKPARKETLAPLLDRLPEAVSLDVAISRK